MDKKILDPAPFGKYFLTEAKGFIVNPCALHLIDSSWMEAINFFKERYLRAHFDHMVSLYVRGSVPRGLAVNNLSDLDIFAIVLAKNKLTFLNESFKSVFLHKFPFIKSIDFSEYLFSDNWVEANPRISMVLKTQSLLIAGKDLASEIKPFKIDKELMIHHHWLKKDLENFEETLSTNHENTRQFLKTLIRSSFELVMLRARKYTPDLYLNALEFAEYCPQFKTTIWKAYDCFLKDKISQNQDVEEFIALTKFLIAEFEQETDLYS